MIISRIVQLINLEWQPMLSPDHAHRNHSIATLPYRIGKILFNNHRFKWKGNYVEFESRFGPILVHVHDQIVKKLKQVIVPSKPFVVLDIGANTGQFGIALRNNIEDLEIHSFEPNNEPFEMLRRNASSSKFWHTYKYGIGHTNEIVDFYWVPGKSGQGSIYHENANDSLLFTSEKNIEITKIQLINSAEILVNTGKRHFDLIKIDVEGAEAIVLEQIKGLSWNFILLEVSQNRIGSIQIHDILQILRTATTNPSVVGKIGKDRDEIYDLIIENRTKTQGKIL
jgi:FkbM family methyltransferase